MTTPPIVPIVEPTLVVPEPIPVKERVTTPVSPTTTAQEDLTVAGQRRINVVWELTQAMIAISVVAAVIFASLYNVVTSSGTEIPSVLSNAAFLVIGFYFSRTNHQAIGGVGKKANENQSYQGR